MNTSLALSYYSADGSFEAAVLAHTQTHATGKTRAAWREQLTGEGAELAQ